MPRTTDELRTQLREQESFLNLMCNTYDAGEKWASKHIAGVIYVLVHDLRNITSLLTQLGVRDNSYFWSTNISLSTLNLLPEMPLVIQTISSETPSHEFLPCFDQGPGGRQRMAQMPFLNWWDLGVIRDAERRVLSRKDLVRSMRDQDGHGHFDPNLSLDAYRNLAQGGDTFFKFVVNGKIVKSPGPHFATMRQIGWEMQQSLPAIWKKLAQ